MKNKALKLLVAVSLMAWGQQGLALMADAPEGQTQASFTLLSGGAEKMPGIQLAKDDGAKKVRQKNLTTEGTMKRVGDKTTIDFEAADISGARRTPLGSMINQNRADKEYDFVKIRLSWHPEMINSAGSLDTKND